MEIFISELLPEEDIKALISEFKVGLELLRFSISDNLDNYNETCRRTLLLLDRLGKPAVTAHGPFLDLNPMAYDSKIRTATMDRFKTARDGALKAGARKIIFHSGMIPSVYYIEGWAERMVAFWEEFLKDHGGIRICMENVLDVEYYPILEVAKAIRHPDFELCLDVGHAHCYSAHPAAEWASALKGNIGHLHLHDNAGSKDSHLALGQGTVPWKEILSILYDASPEQDTLTATLECCSKQDAADSVCLLRKYLDELKSSTL